MLVYQLGRSGWFLDPTYSGGLHPLMGVLYTDVLGLMLFVASDPFYTGEALAILLGLFVQRLHGMLVFLMCYSWCHYKTLKLLHREGGRLLGVSSGRRRRERQRVPYKDLFVILFSFKGVFVSCAM